MSVVAQMVPSKCRSDKQQAGHSVVIHCSYVHCSWQPDLYHANKYKEGPEINSIPLQQSHLSLGLILCWTGGGFWNNTYVSQPQDNWIGRIRESDSCPIRAVTCHGLSSWPATFVHLARSAHQAQTHPAGCPVLLSLHPCQWVQETEALTPFWEGVNDWQCRRGLYHLLPCALSTLSAGSDKPA